MLAGWEMEFDVEARSFYHLPMENSLPYWSSESINNSGDEMILCSICITGSDGTALGVCGFEIGNAFLAGN